MVQTRDLCHDRVLKIVFRPSALSRIDLARFENNWIRARIRATKWRRSEISPMNSSPRIVTKICVNYDNYGNSPGPYVNHMFELHGGKHWRYAPALPRALTKVL